MYNVNTPPASELPSSGALLRSTLIALATAVALLVTVVLPAEYGVDPTGIGSVLGLKEMGEIKMALAEEAAAAEAAEAALALELEAAPSAPVAPPEPQAVAAAAPGTRTDSVTVTLAPGEAKEIKLAMTQGATVNFSWTVEGGVVNSDTHADRPGLDYHGYTKGTNQQGDEGELVAAFDGMHGWFWRNRGEGPVSVTLRTRGTYQEIKQVL